MFKQMHKVETTEGKPNFMKFIAINKYLGATLVPNSIEGELSLLPRILRRVRILFVKINCFS